jgi:hypothetical protein
MCMVRQRSSRVCMDLLKPIMKLDTHGFFKKNIMCCFPDNLQLRQG